MKNILYIAYQFPPLNVGGSARPAKFAKNLRKYGINPIIVTLDPADYYKVYPNANKDSNVLNDFNEELEILKIPSKDLQKDSKNKVKKFLSIFFNIFKIKIYLNS